MDKQLKKLQKQFAKLELHSEWGEFGDGSGEWLELIIIKGDQKAQVVFHTVESGDGVSIWTEERKWDDDSSKRII